MNRNLKIIAAAIIIIVIAGVVCAFSLTGKSNKKDGNKLNIVTTSFSSYDFVKHIVGDKANVTFLLGPGVDAHSYDPTASDLIKIQNSYMFIYIGGEMEQWTDKVLESDTINKDNTSLIKISEAVETIEEQEVDGAEEHEHEHEDFEESDVENRELTDWEGDWQSVYPYLLDGSLDEVMEHKAEEDEEGKTAKDYKEKYEKIYKTDIKNIIIKGNSIEFVKDNSSNKSEYKYNGFYIRENDEGEKQVRYKFEKVADDKDTPKYILFTDHNIKPEKAEHYHIFMSNNSFDEILDKTDNCPTYFKSELNGEEIAEELGEHGHHHEEGAFDEHIWTSPENAIKMMEYLNTEIAKKDVENKTIYQENTDKYVKEIKDVQSQIKEITSNKKRNRLVFGDKMPMQYFLNEFNLTASAAFDGCSTETEPSSKTIAYLVNKVKEEKIPVVLYIELSTGKTAKTIADETGAKAMQIQTLHNVSKDDFNKGETYVSLMRRNLEVLKQALQ